MVTAQWNGQIIAQSDEYEEVEGNIYFPPASVHKEFLIHSDTTSTCPWKGTASYFTVEVDGHKNPDAAWYYPDPKPEASHIKGYIAFWNGVKITT